MDVVREAGPWSTFGDVDTTVQSAADAVAASHAGAVTGECFVGVSLSNDDIVAELNGRYRNKPKPTNVLSFPSADPRAPDHLGDIIFAHETVLAEAADLDIPPAHHLQHLTVHALLHLLGHDHETDADAAAMEALETRILATIGVADPYAGTEPV